MICVVGNGVTLTVHSQHVRLHNIFVTLCMTRVVAGVNQLDSSQVQGSVTEHPHLILIEGCQISLVPSPYDGGRWRSSHITLNLDIVPDTGRQMVHLQGLV